MKRPARPGGDYPWDKDEEEEEEEEEEEDHKRDEAKYQPEKSGHS